MATDGNITVWVSNGYAFARLESETKAGPIIVQASAPLAVIRQRLMDEQGDFVEGEGDHLVGEAEVHRAAKNAAVGNLRRLAPYALVPAGGLATYYGVRAMRRRRHGRPGSPPPRELPEDENSIEGAEIGDAAARQAGALALTVAKQDPKVRAGMFLLRRARKDPRARRKVKVIKARAAAGDPIAQRDQKTLVRAHRVETALARQQREKDRAAARRLALLKVPRPPLSLARATRPEGGMVTSRYRGFFAPWERGAE
jgi:hypothetical protein